MKMTVEAERGRLIKVTWPWMLFALKNPDIMADLNSTPLHVQRVDEKAFKGEIFGLNLDLELVCVKTPFPEDEFHIITNVIMPWGLGRTSTVAHYSYSATSSSSTMLALNFLLVSNGLALELYLRFIKKRIDKYVSQILDNFEKAARLLEKNDPALKKLLNEDQLVRIDEFKQKLSLEENPPDEKLPPTGVLPPILPPLKPWHPELIELTELYVQMQGKTNRLEEELIRIRETRDTVATLLVARRMLELIVTHICEEKLKRPRGNHPLARIMSKIEEEHIVPGHIMTSMQNLNRLCTYGAHPKPFSPRQVREALMALCSIMEWFADSGLKTPDCPEQPST